TEMSDQWYMALSSELMASYSMFGERTLYIVDQEKFNEIAGPSHSVLIGKIDNFTDYSTILEKIDERHQQLAKKYTGEEPATVGSKFEQYTLLKGVSNGTV